MPRPTSKATKDPWAAFADALAKSGEKRPIGPNWLDMQEIGKKLGKTRVAAQTFITRNRDKFDQFRGCVAKGNKLVTAIWWRPKQSIAKPIKTS